MKACGSKVLDLLWQDAEPREVLLRKIISERIAAKPPPCVEDSIVATYFFAFRSLKLTEAVAEQHHFERKSYMQEASKESTPAALAVHASLPD